MSDDREKLQENAIGLLVEEKYKEAEEAFRKTSKVKADTSDRSRPDRNKPQIISKKTRWQKV